MGEQPQGPNGGGRGGIGEGGQNGNAWGGPCGVIETKQGTIAREWTTAEEGRGQQDHHDYQVSSIGDRGKHRRSPPQGKE